MIMINFRIQGVREVGASSDAHWLRMETTTQDVGGPKLPTYVVNPKIKIESATEENFF